MKKSPDSKYAIFMSVARGGVHAFSVFMRQKTFNSPGKTVHSMNGLVLNASESTDTQIGNRWNNNVMCEILSAFSSYQYFQNLTLLSVINLSKTRRRSAFLREIYNLNTVLIYGISWNFHWWWIQTYWTRLWPQNLRSIFLSRFKP